MSDLHETVIPALMRDEGKRLKPYRDRGGVLTIGYGCNLDDGITDDEALFLLENRIDRAIADCQRVFPWFATLDQTRQGVLVQLCYQLGLARLCGFRRMLAALERHDYATAAHELLDSKLAREDAPARAARQAHTISTGNLT